MKRKAQSAVLVWLVALGCALTATGQDANVASDPTVQWQAQIKLACQQFVLGDEQAWQSFQSKVELAMLDAQLNFEHGIHERAVGLWLGAKSYTAASGEPNARNQLKQTGQNAHQILTEKSSQLHNAQAQAVSQLHNDMQQAFGRELQTLHQTFNTRFQSYHQAVDKFDGTLINVRPSDFLMERTEESLKTLTEAQQAYAAALEKGRAAYRQAVGDATKAWKQKTDELAAKWDGTDATRGDVETEMRKENRKWMLAGTQAIEDLRAAFRDAQRKLQLQTEQ